MHEGRRPGGLTALAVLNFVGAGIDVLGIVGLLITITIAGPIADKIERDAKARAASGDDTAEPKLSEHDEQTLAAMHGLERIGRGKLVACMALLGACGAALITAGIGYLRQRRWSRLLGNVYAVLASVAVVSDMFIMPREAGGGFRFTTVIGFIYPVATLFFLNTTFREDLRS